MFDKKKNIYIYAHPSPVATPFDPEDVLDARPLAGSAVVAEPASLRHLDVQTFPMKRGGTGLATQQAAPCTAQHSTGELHFNANYSNDPSHKPSYSRAVMLEETTVRFKKCASEHRSHQLSVSLRVT